MVHKTIKELEKEIKEQKKKLFQESEKNKKLRERQELQRQLFRLKNKGLFNAGEKAKRISSRFGRGFVRIGKKVAPAIQKQSALIRQQQLRDQAIQGKLSKGKISKTKGTAKRKRIIKRLKPQTTRLVFVPGLGMVTQKVVQGQKKRKKKRIITRPKVVRDEGIFSNLDF